MADDRRSSVPGDPSPGETEPTGFRLVLRSVRRTKRNYLALIALVLGGAIGGGVYGGMAFVRYSPPKVSFMHAAAPGKAIHLVFETDPQMGKGYTHPAWVTYFVKAPDGKWVHSAIWELPAYTRVDVTAYNFDSGTNLRNYMFSRVTGTLSGHYTVNGKAFSVMPPAAKVTSAEKALGVYGESHTWTVPQKGINIPMPAVNGSAKSFCLKAPCLPSEHIHNTVTFSFMTGAPRVYHWQCIYPCAASYLDGNGGPMQTVGYMDGFLEVRKTNSHQTLRVGG